MLGLRIATLRRNAGISQNALAERLGISQSAVGMYEQGRREPSADILVALSRIFDVTIDYLLTGHSNSSQDLIAMSKILSHRYLERESGETMYRSSFSQSDLLVLLMATLMREKS